MKGQCLTREIGSSVNVVELLAFVFMLVQAETF